MAEETKQPVAAVATQENVMGKPYELSTFGSKEGFELAQRQAKMLAISDIVPAQFRGKVENCVIALEMSGRMGASPLMIMQNLCIVHGNPSFSSKFLIATLNACGRFSPLRYIVYDEAGNEIKKPNPAQKPFGCVAYAIDKSTGEELYGTLVDLNMAKSEGWSTKQGSKWITMPGLMLQYRAAAFFQRTYAPEVSMGMLSTEEVEDIGYEQISSRPLGKFSNVPNAEQVQQFLEAEEEEAAAKQEQPQDVEPKLNLE